MATYLSNDGCSGQIVPNISLFNPYLLNTDNWVQTMIDFGAKYAVLVAKVKINLSFDCLYFS
jgi:alpha-L-fucosidase